MGDRSWWIFVKGDSFYWSYEAIASAGQGLDESGIAGGVSEGFADAVDRGVYTVFVVDEGSVGPQLAGDLFSGEEFAWPLQEHEEDLEGLGVQLDADALTAEFAQWCVCFKYSEAVAPVWLWVGHVSCQVYSSECRS